MCVNIQGLIDIAKCYRMVRQLRWPEQVKCPHCHATQIHEMTTLCNGIVVQVPSACSKARSLLRSWFRPHREIFQERLPAHVGFFQFVHNARLRGNSLLQSLVEALVCINPGQEWNHDLFPVVNPVAPLRHLSASANKPYCKTIPRFY